MTNFNKINQNKPKKISKDTISDELLTLSNDFDLGSIKTLTAKSLCKTFSEKHTNIIYYDLISNQMNVNSTYVLRKYKTDIQHRFFTTKYNYANIFITHHQKYVLLNIFKAIRLFRLSRTNLIALRLFRYIPYFNMDLIRCISGYLC